MVTAKSPFGISEVNVAEVPVVAQVGQIVLVESGALGLTGVGEQGAGLAEQVQRDVADGHVLLDLRGAGNPFGEALAEDKRVVAEAERVRRQRRRGGCGAHRWDTPSGRS